MKVTLTLRDGTTRAAKVPYEGADHIIADGACANCKSSPFNIIGIAASMRHDHDTYHSDAGCLNCRAVVGRLAVKVSTLFGIEEDERIQSMGVRVY